MNKQWFLYPLSILTLALILGYLLTQKFVDATKPTLYIPILGYLIFDGEDIGGSTKS